MHLNIYDNCSSIIEEWETILNHYDDCPSEGDIWEIARESKKLPILGNIYQDLILNRIISHFCEETGLDYDDLDVFIFVNSVDTHLSINGKYIYSVQDYLDCIKLYK
ncbi:hypothetical protein IO43_02465 [Gallibacterium anatis 7990]|uniref:hypothetical protein n=1 Tax=Gallibacterium anatis TaxID=750 RepID=UPI000531A3D6|nr:hypothetical protein [Gallibacterium anatis]KGQ65502.1 hypothetical protein IO43_02465 [Gallibacterium anatis 7990]